MYNLGEKMDLWTMLKQIEKSADCIIYGVLDLQSVENDLAMYAEFDSENSMGEEFIISASDISKQDLLDAMQFAYRKVDDCNDGYNQYLDVIHEYLVVNLKLRQCVCGNIDCKDEYSHTTSGW